MNTPILIPTEKLIEELEIKKDAYYADLKFLGIEIIKNNLGKSYVTSDDAERMKSLRKWVNKTGTRRGFEYKGRNNSQEVEEKAQDSALIKSNSELRTQNSELFIHEDEEDIYVTPDEPTDNINVDGLIREASELKAREIAMPELVKRAIADKLEEDDLPLDLQEKIGLAREAANPKFTPSMVAEKLLAQYRLKRAG